MPYWMYFVEIGGIHHDDEASSRHYPSKQKAEDALKTALAMLSERERARAISYVKEFEEKPD